jgi:hypothetical protein
MMVEFWMRLGELGYIDENKVADRSSYEKLRIQLA